LIHNTALYAGVTKMSHIIIYPLLRIYASVANIGIRDLAAPAKKH